MSICYSFDKQGHKYRVHAEQDHNPLHTTVKCCVHLARVPPHMLVYGFFHKSVVSILKLIKLGDMLDSIDSFI